MNVLLFPSMRCLLIGANCSGGSSVEAVLGAHDLHHKRWVSKRPSDLQEFIRFGLLLTWEDYKVRSYGGKEKSWHLKSRLKRQQKETTENSDLSEKRKEKKKKERL